MVAVTTSRTRIIRRWRLGILLVIQGLALAVYVYSRLFPVSIDQLSPSGQSLIADAKALGGNAQVGERFPGYVGWIGKSEEFHVNFSGCSLDDESFGRFLARHGQRIRSLNLQHTPITDAGLRHLAWASRLEDIDLGNHSLTRFARVRRPNRTTPPLSLITDAGLIHLTTLAHLKRLSLSEIPVTDAGLTCVSSLPELEVLELKHTKVKGVSLGASKALPRLWSVNLEGREITDSTLGYLAGATNIRYLSLMDVTITGDGLKHLKSLPQLEGVSLFRCGLLDDEVAALRESLPELKIDKPN